MNSKPIIVTTQPEQRQIAKVLAFREWSEFIDWEKIAEQAKQLGAHFEVRKDVPEHGQITITMFWSYAEGEISG